MKHIFLSLGELPKLVSYGSAYHISVTVFVSFSLCEENNSAQRRSNPWFLSHGVARQHVRQFYTVTQWY